MRRMRLQLLSAKEQQSKYLEEKERNLLTEQQSSSDTIIKEQKRSTFITEELAHLAKLKEQRKTETNVMLQALYDGEAPCNRLLSTKTLTSRVTDETSLLTTEGTNSNSPIRTLFSSRNEQPPPIPQKSRGKKLLSAALQAK